MPPPRGPTKKNDNPPLGPAACFWSWPRRIFCGLGRNSSGLADLRRWWSFLSTALHVSIACAREPSVDARPLAFFSARCRAIDLRARAKARRNQFLWRVPDRAGSRWMLLTVFLPSGFSLFPRRPLSALEADSPQSIAARKRERERRNRKTSLAALSNI